MPEDIKKITEDLKMRVERLEEAVFGAKQFSASPSVVTNVDFAGLDYLRQLESVVDKCLAVLDYLSSTNVNHPGLTPDELVEIFKDKFGIVVVLSTISSALLGVTGKYVTRKKIGNRPVRYRYQILPKGREYVRTKREGLQG